MTATPHNPATLQLLDWADDPLEALAETLLQQQLASLPRLEHVSVLLPETGGAPRLRQILLDKAAALGHPALLGPQILDWRSWLNRFGHDLPATASDYRRELILLEALRRHAHLFGAGNLWALADSLLQLFDELTLNQVGLPDDLKEFNRRLAAGYGLPQPSEALEREAQLVHTLWHAWHQELHDRKLIDRNTRHLLQLATSSEQSAASPLYLLAPAGLCRAERQWLTQMVGTGKLTLLLHGRMDTQTRSERRFHPERPIYSLLEELPYQPAQPYSECCYSRLLDALYGNQAERLPLRERALGFVTDCGDSPLADRLYVHSADSDEGEARAVELQVRRWLLQGHQQIGIVTENRRLARRVRALLERADISLEDSAGWALSTTSAAAVLERWLQCVEEDFPYRAMLDLLKSPFFTPPSEREAHLQRVYRLEQDVVLHENVGSGIERYRRHLDFRRDRLRYDGLDLALQAPAELLGRLQQAAEPLQAIICQGQHEASDTLSCLLHSLETLGVTPQLGNDAAGMRLLEELQKMQQALRHEAVRMDWLAFRSWLGRALERYTFQPPATSHSVSLSGLSQAPHARFDALIIAGLEQEHLPGSAPTTPFFNAAVRRELGLPDADEQLSVRFYHFRRLLESAPLLLLSHRRHSNGEEIAPSPWLEQLLAFHQLAYATSLADTELERLLTNPASQVVCRSQPLPQLASMPSPALDSALLPKRYSASAYQQLIDCPYQFFAARGLGLTAPEAIREALEKSDYGERVHRCLQAFHGDIPELPGPYTGGWEPKRRTEAITLLEQISHAVFAEDLEDNFLHRGWLQRWLGQIPSYIDWQLARSEKWRVVAVEQQGRRENLIPGVLLHGRLDRVDSDGVQLGVIDYKTGQPPKEDEVLAGEAVQLPFYTLLAAEGALPVGRVEYLALDSDRVESKSPLEEQQLAQLGEATAARLAILQKQLLEGAALPAWGDEKVCSRCQLSGVCRRTSWLGQ